MKKRNICVVGLGYVGLPLACLLSKKFPVIGFDINKKRIEELQAGQDRTHEVEDIKQYSIEYTYDEKKIGDADFIIVAVPTPIDDYNEPDLRLLESASGVVGKNIKKGAVISFESTVYPGCTEEVCVPLLEKFSGMKYGKDFRVAYSPERVNPGDKTHTIDKVTKIVSGSDAIALKAAADVYGSVTNIHKASSIKVAEAAKVIENVQRDLNIALMNELALIFSKFGIDTKEVIEAAATKWNFHKYTPGLVGGHCIGVDPYYLTYKARQIGYEPKVILSGRETNNYMPRFIADFVKIKLSKNMNKPKVLVYGLTFKENVPDIRNSKAKELISRLKHLGMDVYGQDPLVEGSVIEEKFSVTAVKWPWLEKFDAVILKSPHKEFLAMSLQELKLMTVKDCILFDIKGILDKNEAKKVGFDYHRL